MILSCIFSYNELQLLIPVSNVQHIPNKHHTISRSLFRLPFYAMKTTCRENILRQAWEVLVTGRISILAGLKKSLIIPPDSLGFPA
jgi:hypothetical protein